CALPISRCIAMVFIWNDMACGDREAAAVLVAINSVFQLVAYAALGWFYLQALPSWLGLETTSAEFSIGAIVVSVLVFLGLPLLAGFLTRTFGAEARGRAWARSASSPATGRGSSLARLSASGCRSPSRGLARPPGALTWH